MLTYEEFKNEIEHSILDFIPNVEGDVKINKVAKENDVVLDGLTILQPDKNISPTIYLNGIYNEYLNGLTLENCMHKIAVMYGQSMPEHNFDVKFIMDFENVKDKLTFSICRADENKELLKNCISQVKGDFALIPKIQVSVIDNGNEHSNEQTQGTIKITKQIAEAWDKNENEIMDCAIKNAKELQPAKFRNMAEILSEMMDIPKEVIENMYGDETMPMYVLSNETNLNGAATMFYPDVLNDIRKQLKAELIIIPSSIHETIIVPYNDVMSERDISSIIQEVNTNELRPEEVLSDKAYMYQSATREIVPMETFLQEEKSIIDDIKKAGFKATRNLVVAIKEVSAAVGCQKSLKDIASMLKEKITDETLEDKLNQVADICKSQEKARTQDEPSL